MIGKRRRQQQSVTRLAKGEVCQIRLAGVCNGNPETVSPCHYRLAGISGFGFIADSLFVAHGCSSCHRYCDSNHDFQTKLALAEGVFRTQALLKERGVIVVAA